MLLTLNDLQGDASGLAETNILNSQLDSGDFSMPNIYGAVKDSRAIDVTLEEGERGDDSTVEAHCSYKRNKYRNKRRHQVTQTEPFSLSIAAIVVHGQIEDPCEYNAQTCNIFTTKLTISFFC